MVLSIAMIVLFNTSTALAGCLPWNNHAAPFSFLFGNHIDGHQQSILAGNNVLKGFLYIHFMGDTVDGVPVAHHTDCTQMPEMCVPGWSFTGIPVRATLVENPSMHEPLWCVPAAVVKPGYTHFHWLGNPDMAMNLVIGQEYEGYLMKLTALNTFYFGHHGSLSLVTPGLDTNSHLNVITQCNQ